MINIIVKENNKIINTLNSDKYFILCGAGDRIEMMSNLEPESLLMFLMPFLVELEEIIEREIYK